MAQKLSPWQIYEAKAFAGQVSDVYFENMAMGGKNPQLISKVVRQLLNRNAYTYSTYLTQFPTLKIEDHNEEFMWKLIGDSEKNIPLSWAKVGSSLVTAATTGVGSLGAKFTLAFPEKWFNEGEIIVGEKNELYRIKLLSSGIPSGNDVIYEAELTGENYVYGIPGSELIAGKLFSFEYTAPIELEGHGDQGGLRFGGEIAMKQEVTAIRKSYKVYGRELGRKLMTPIRYKAGDEVKEFNMSIPMVMWQFEKELEQEYSKLLIYGRTNRDEYGTYHDRGRSGNVIKMGAGIRQQRQIGNTFVYDKFTIDYITEILDQLSEGRFDYKNRIYTMRTGSRGAKQFHNAIADKLNAWYPTNGIGDNNVALTKSVSSQMHDNSVSIGMQFTEYRAPNGVILRVEVDPMYDDTKRNKIMKNNSERYGPAESYRYDIDYIGADNDVNIQLVEVTGWEGGKYATHGGPAGFGNPFGGEGHGANQWDEYTYTKQMRGGAVVYNPELCMTLLPQELAQFA